MKAKKTRTPYFAKLSLGRHKPLPAWQVVVNGTQETARHLWELIQDLAKLRSACGCISGIKKDSTTELKAIFGGFSDSDKRPYLSAQIFHFYIRSISEWE